MSVEVEDVEQISEFVDDRQKIWCIHCGASLAGAEVNRDHVPSKGFLIAPYPENLPVVRVCKACNESFSDDEEYMIAFIGAVLAGSVEPAQGLHPTAGRILERNAKLKARIERAGTKDLFGRIVWEPERNRIDRVVLKNARGHAFFELGEPLMDAPDQIRSMPLALLSVEQRADFENVSSGGLSAWPEVGSRMTTRLMSGQDYAGGWVVVQDDVYRYAAFQSDGIVVRTVLFEYLATEVCWNI